MEMKMTDSRPDGSARSAGDRIARTAAPPRAATAR